MMNTTESDKPNMVTLQWCLKQVKEQKEVSVKKCEEHWEKLVEDCEKKIQEYENQIGEIDIIMTEVTETMGNMVEEMKRTKEEDESKYLELQKNFEEEQKKVEECTDKFNEVISNDWDKLNECQKSIRWLIAFDLIGEGNNNTDIRTDAKQKYRKFILKMHPDKGNVRNNLIVSQVIQSYNLVYKNEENMKCFKQIHGEEESVIAPIADPITSSVLGLENIPTPSLEQKNKDATEPTNSKKGYVVWMLILCVVGLGSFLAYLLLNREYINTSKSLFQTIEKVKYINRLKFYRELSLIVFIITFVVCFIFLMFYIFSSR